MAKETSCCTVEELRVWSEFIEHMVEQVRHVTEVSPSGAKGNKK